MDSIQTVLWFLAALGILVTFHEFGHYYVARRCGVRVLRFSIGFGKPLFSIRDNHGTEFCIAPIPLGGYVKMLDEREGEVAEKDLPYAFTQQSVWKRMAIVVAGPVANLILAVIFFWIALLPGKADFVPIVHSVESGSIAEQAGLEEGQEIIAVDGKPTPTLQDLHLQLINRIGETGTLRFTVRYPESDYQYTSEAQIENWLRDVDEPEPIKDLGLQLLFPSMMEISLPEEIGEIVAGSPAEDAGIRVGDTVVRIEGQPDVTTWDQFRDYVSAHANANLELVILRDQRELRFIVAPVPETLDDGETVVRLGIAPASPAKLIRHYYYSVPGAFAQAAQNTWDTCKRVLLGFKKLIIGELSPKYLSGPITIAKVAGSHARAGWIYFVEFLALLSVTLGVLNLFPIPVLDGGHLVYFVIEAIKGSPISERVQMIGFQIGMFLIMGVMLFALYNDFGRL